jgi:adapter protein MecA 1/2
MLKWKGEHKMEIERINDYTVKFFITYIDIEDRGYDREEIWQNRDRGEELFWDLMDEANEREQFPVEGPLWIQVQAMDEGLEMTVTRASLSNDGTKLELPISDEKHIDIPVDDNIEALLDTKLNNNEDDESEDEIEEDILQFLFSFDDIEDVLSLSQQVQLADIENDLYHMEGYYYLHVSFHDDMPEKDQDDILSQLLEYGIETGVTIYRVQEYGKVILEKNALSQLKEHFSTKN